MTEFSTLVQQGHAWLFLPSAIVLGALHGLEPGHSKTMMAAFIIAIRGTVSQAVLLGVAATLSHTAVVWMVAMIGLYFGQNWNAESAEPYFQTASGLMILSIALWMLWRTRRLQQAEREHGHGHDHSHHHGHGGGQVIDTGHGRVRLEIFADGVPPRFRLQSEAGPIPWAADQVRIETERPDGRRQTFTFVQRGITLESVEEISEPHEFVARLHLGHGHHNHDFDLELVENHRHHAIGDYQGLDLAAPVYQDPHQLAHANDIRHRFANRQVTTAQIVLFGLTGGLIPCPASITVLLLCLHLKQLALGATLVLCFSLGLALTMVASGVLAALSMRHVSSRWRGFGAFARRAPYFSGVLIVLVGLWVCGQGLRAMQM